MQTSHQLYGSENGVVEVAGSGVSFSGIEMDNGDEMGREMCFNGGKIDGGDERGKEKDVETWI